MRAVPALLVLAGCTFDAAIGPGYRCDPGHCDAAPSDGAPAAPDAAPDPSLVAWYRFEDDPSDGVLDSTGHGHDGTCSPCPTMAPGQLGWGYQFDGSEYVEIGGGGAFASSTAVTIAGWERLDSPIDQTPLSKPLAVPGSPDVNAWQFEVQPPAQGCLTGPDKVCVDNAIVWGQWQHFAGVWDGANKRLYIDGVKVLDVPATLALDGEDILIGADFHLDPTTGAPTGAFVQVVGVLDDIRIYDRVLSDQEIAALATP